MFFRRLLCCFPCSCPGLWREESVHLPAHDNRQGSLSFVPCVPAPHSSKREGWVRLNGPHPLLSKPEREREREREKREREKREKEREREKERDAHAHAHAHISHEQPATQSKRSAAEASAVTGLTLVRTDSEAVVLRTLSPARTPTLLPAAVFLSFSASVNLDALGARCTYMSRSPPRGVRCSSNRRGVLLGDPPYERPLLAGRGSEFVEGSGV